MGLFDAIFKARQTAQEQVDKLNDELGRLRARQQAIQLAPASKADVKAVVARAVAAKAASVAPAASAVLSALARDPARLNTDAAIAVVGLLSAGRSDTAAASAAEIDAALAALFPAQLEAALCRLVDALPEDGPTLEARSAELAKVEARIADVSDEVNKLYTDAQAAGVTLN